MVRNGQRAVVESDSIKPNIPPVYQHLGPVEYASQLTPPFPSKTPNSKHDANPSSTGKANACP
jgi:hypothetical protein